MHYLTLQKIYNQFNKQENREKEKELTKKLDKYIFSLSKAVQAQIQPYSIINHYKLKNDDAQKMFIILTIAQELDMFELIYEAECPNGFVIIDEVEITPEKETYTIYCDSCDEEHNIRKKDLIISYKLNEEPIYKTFLKNLFGGSAA
jgi:hypothetical protein